MIKVYINNEEVLCDKNIVIKKEMLNTSSTILNNVYPKSWETTHDYTTNYYYPLDYSNCKITDIRETPAEEGQTIEGTNFNINVDLSKEYSFDDFKGNTTQGVPGGYTQVDYIQSNNTTHNTNYIDLGFKPNNNTSLELEFEYYAASPNYSRLYGSSNLFRVETDGTNTTSKFWWNNANRYSKSSIEVNTKYIVKQDKNLLYWNGELINTAPEGQWQDIYKLRLFSATTGDRDSKVRIYYAKLWDNGTLIRYMIPAIRNSDNAIGMVDLVNNVFYENQGTTPFTYGSVVTPSPDTPIPIQTTTGEQDINVVGKNLLPLTNASDTYKQTTISVENGIIHEITNYTGTGEYATAFSFTDNISHGNYANYTTPTGNGITLKAGTYTYSYKKISGDAPTYNLGGKSRSISVFKVTNTPYTSLGNARILGDTASVTFTLTEATTISLTYGYYFSGENVTSDVYFTLQLEKENQATDFEKYIENTYPINLGDIELCKIGDYQDRVYKDNDKWYIEKQIRKVVLDGSENYWSLEVTKEATQVFKGSDSVKDKLTTNDNFYSNYFINQAGDTEKIAFSGTTMYLALNKETASTLEEFKTWLSTHNTTVYYVLKTPTTTEITDTELINQLESIELIEGTNNISSNGNLPIIMNLHYNYVTHRIDTILLFSGIVKNTGNISLNPREPHYSSIEVLGYETFLSEGETLDFVIYEKTIEEAIDLVINTISDYGIIKGNINIKNPNDIIGAYSTKDKTAYDVFNYIADITQSRWTTRIIDENTIAIDFYDPDLMTNGIDLDFTQEFFANNNIIDMQYNYGTRDYRNKQVMNSSAVYSNIETNETIIADGYQTQFNTTDKIGEITKITLNGTEVIVKTKDEYELGYTCDFYYTPGNNYFESVDLVNTGAVLVIDYYAIIQGREILLNNTEINRVSSMTGRKGVISRYEDRNDATTTTELSQIGQSYLRYKGSPEIILKIESLNDIWDIGEKVEFNNAPLNELATEYMVKKKTIHYIPTVDNIFYDFELTSNFNSENAINYFDNQRSKNKGNIGQGETISRNIDISNTANVIFYNVDIQEVSIDGDNTLNSTLNSPLVQ